MKNIEKLLCGTLCLSLLLGTAALADESVPDTVENVSSALSEQETTDLSDSTEKDSEETDQKEATDEKPEAVKADDAQPEGTADGTPSQESEKTDDASEPESSTPEINEITVTVNGEIVDFDDVKPQISDGRTLVPFRKVGAAMNAAVAWRGSDRTAHYFRNGISVMLTIGKSEMEVREYEIGEKFVYTTEAEIFPIDPDQPSVIARTIDDRTMIPIRATAEALGAKVDWDNATKTVVITIPSYSLKLADKDAAALIENWNYKPATELKTGSVTFKIIGDFADADAAKADGIAVTLGDKTQITSDGGSVTFDKTEAGTYSLKIDNIPEGYSVADGFSYETAVVAAEKTEVKIPLVKTKQNAESEKSTDSKTDKKTEKAETAAK